MMKKLGIVLMTAFFSISVAGLSFADEAKPMDPSAGKEEMKKEEVKQFAYKKGKTKTALKKEKEEAPAAPASTPAPEKKKKAATKKTAPKKEEAPAPAPEKK